MIRFIRFGLTIVVVLCCLAECWGAVTAEQRKEVAELQSALTKAGNLFKQKKFKESADAVRQVQTGMEKLSASSDKEVLGLLEPLHGRLKIAHGLLEIEGLELPPLKELKAASAKTPDKAPATPAP